MKVNFNITMESLQAADADACWVVTLKGKLLNNTKVIPYPANLSFRELIDNIKAEYDSEFFNNIVVGYE